MFKEIDNADNSIVLQDKRGSEALCFGRGRILSGSHNPELGLCLSSVIRSHPQSSLLKAFSTFTSQPFLRKPLTSPLKEVSLLGFPIFPATLNNSKDMSHMIMHIFFSNFLDFKENKHFQE